MAQIDTKPITSSIIFTKYGYPQNYTFVALNGVALSGVPSVIDTTSEGWPISAVISGTQIDITLDTSSNVADGSGPGIRWPLNGWKLEFTDNDSVSRWTNIDPIVAFGPVPAPANLPPVGIDDTVSMTASSTLNFNPRVNDTDPDGTVDTIQDVTVVTPGIVATLGLDNASIDIDTTGTPVGTYDITYRPVDDDGLPGNVTTVTVTVTAFLGFPYFIYNTNGTGLMDVNIAAGSNSC